jgi:hypothetical protein
MEGGLGRGSGIVAGDVSAGSSLTGLLPFAPTHSKTGQFP